MMETEPPADAVAKLSLIGLPAEVLAHICTYLIPANQTFILNARTPGTAASKSSSVTRVSPRIRGTPLLSEDDEGPQHPASVFQTFGVNVDTLLLLHSRIYPHIITCLYSNNVFYPYDLTTLLCFQQSLSPLAISNIRNIRIDACGPANRFTRGYNHFYSWTQLADTDIVTIPELFPGLRELRIGGVGPGVVHRRVFTYRGSRCVRDIEINDIWTLDNISLISKIVGIGLNETSEDEQSDSQDEHALSNGRVFYMHYEGSEPPSLPRGSYRLHGTRIVRAGEHIRQGVIEREMVNLRSTLARTREAYEEFKSSGLSEVSVHDLSLG